MRRTPPKPYPTFPLFGHANGSWTKKISGRHERFGPWRWPDRDAYEQSWKSALKRYEDWLEALAKGELARVDPRSIELTDMVDQFLAPQHQRAEDNKVKPRSFAELRAIVTEFRDVVGKHLTIGQIEAEPARVEDYLQHIQAFGWCAFNKRIKLVRSLFNWAVDPPAGVLGNEPFKWMNLLVERPLREFRRQRRRDREQGAVTTFGGDEVRVLVDHAPQPLRSMILLGYFAAYGNTDLGELPDSALTIEEQPQRLFIRGRQEEIPAGWGRLYFPRPKTELDRFALVPPFVVSALRDADRQRPRPATPQWKNRRFLTRGGERVCYEVVHRDPAGLIERVSIVDNIGQVWRRLITRLGRCATHGWRVRKPFTREREDDGTRVLRCPECDEAMTSMRRRGFYALRHTATTFAAASGASDDTRKIFEGHVDRQNPTRQTFYLDPTQLHDLLLIARELMARAGFTESEQLPPPPASAVSTRTDAPAAVSQEAG